MGASPSQRSGLPLVDFSVCCALGAGRAAVHARLRGGQSGLAKAPFELPFEAPCGLVPEALPELPARFRQQDTRQARLALCALLPLLPAVSKLVARIGGARVGLVLGSSNGGLDTTETSYRAYVRDGQVPHDFSLRQQHDFAAALRLVAEVAGISGPAQVVSTACSSSGKAFASASRWIHAGLVDAVLVGGIDALCELTVRGFRSLGVLAEEPCRPFGMRRPGINIGEGAAMFLLARGADAPFALVGTGESADAHHMTAPDPRGDGAERAMRQALNDAGLSPADIQLVNAHGTGTPQGDIAEAAAIARLFGAEVPVVSTKAYTGHALGASGAIEAALSLLSLEHSFAPQSLGAQPPDTALGINLLQTPREGSLARVLSNSFAFGGSNVSVILGRAA